VLITPPPYDAEKYQFPSFGRNNQATGKYAKCVVDIAVQLQLDYIDLWNDMQNENKNWEEYLCDGVHLSVSGNQFLWLKLKKILVSIYNKVETIPLDFPVWRTLNFEHPEETILEFDKNII